MAEVARHLGAEADPAWTFGVAAPEDIRRLTQTVGFWYDWDESRIRAAAPLVQEKIAKLGEFPAFAGFLFHDVEVDPAGFDGRDLEVVSGAREVLSELEPFDAVAIETSLRSLLERLGLKPRQGFQPIRIAVTGSKISPGLFESIELLGRETTLARLSAAAS